VAANVQNAQKEVQVTFLWQNNFAREVSVPTSNGEYNLPISAEGETVLDDISARPDPDVVKLDYSTRSLMNVRLGARVYYAGPGRPITIEVSDRVKINNVGR
jgi:hypothetical protein